MKIYIIIFIYKGSYLRNTTLRSVHQYIIYISILHQTKIIKGTATMKPQDDHLMFDPNVSGHQDIKDFFQHCRLLQYIEVFIAEGFESLPSVNILSFFIFFGSIFYFILFYFILF